MGRARSKQILFVQGAGEAAHDEWDEKLVDSLKRQLGDGYDVRYPCMPNEADPHYAAWKASLLSEMDRLEDGAVLVGHSIGATVVIHALAEHRPKQELSAILLIAMPFIGEGGWPSDEMKSRTDFAKRLPAEIPIFLYHGTEDQTVPIAHVELYARLIPRAIVQRLPGRDHQLNDDLSAVARDIRSLT